MAAEPAVAWQPNWAVPPGEILLEILQDRGMPQSELARRMDRPIKTVNEIVKGKAAITPETAIQLERALGVSARFWINLEANFREALARQQARKELESESSWAASFPLRELIRFRLLRAGVSPGETVHDLLTFFGVSSRSAWEKQWLAPVASLRASAAHRSVAGSVAAWLRWGEIDAASIDCQPFSAHEFRRVLATIRGLTAVEPFAEVVGRVRDLCAKCGVAVIVTPELSGAPLSGAARWLTANKALLQLSLRHKTDDQFWFTFFHEAGHLLSPRRRDFVDAVDGMPADDDTAEDSADRFAREILIPPQEYQRFVGNNDFSGSAVRAFADQLGIAPGIVVGRLHRDKHLLPSQLRSLKKTIRWLQPPRRPRSKSAE